MARQKPYFHVSSLKEYRENDPNRFKSHRMDKPAPILIDNAEEWKAEQILDYGRQNNRHEFLVHWKGYQRADDSWEPIENLDHSLELIQESWDANHPAEPTPQITSHYIKLPGNLWKFPLRPAQLTIAQTTSGNPMTMRNMILAALSRTITPQMTTPSYGTPTRALRTARTLE